jgi:dCTP diphosphatase
MVMATSSDQETPIAALRERLRAFARERDWEQFHLPKDLAQAVSVEAAELLELYLWQPSDTDRAPAPIDPARRTRLAEEIADVAICLLNLCNALDLDLASAIDAKLQKNALKYPVETSRGRARPVP